MAAGDTALLRAGASFGLQCNRGAARSGSKTAAPASSDWYSSCFVSQGMSHTENDRLQAEVAKLHLEAQKLRIEVSRMERPFWRQASFWRSVLTAGAVSAAAYAAMSRVV